MNIWQTTRIKRNLRGKNSPGEHRSKYFNDVFTSRVNLGEGMRGAPKQETVNKLLQELPRGGRVHFDPQNHITSSLSGKLI